MFCPSLTSACSLRAVCSARLVSTASSWPRSSALVSWQRVNATRKRVLYLLFLGSRLILPMADYYPAAAVVVAYPCRRTRFSGFDLAVLSPVVKNCSPYGVFRQLGVCIVAQLPASFCSMLTLPTDSMLLRWGPIPNAWAYALEPSRVCWRFCKGKQ